MAKRQQQTTKGSSRKVGNQKSRCEAYRLRGTLLKNKIKRIRRSNGLVAVESYKRDPQKAFPKERRE